MVVLVQMMVQMVVLDSDGGSVQMVVQMVVLSRWWFCPDSCPDGGSVQILVQMMVLSRWFLSR